MKIDSKTQLQIENLEVGYKKVLLPALNVTIRKGEMWALVGPNGAGKTTLLRTILGLLSPVRGKISSKNAQLSYVPQRSSLDPNTPARVLDLVRSGTDRKWSILDPTFVFRKRKIIHEILSLTNTFHLRKTKYGNLSEGQKQRVLIARALTSSPSTLILDEPTSAMDLAAEQDLMKLLNSLRSSKNLAIIIVSHHLQVVLNYATHAIILDRKRKLAFAGTKKEIAQDPFVRAFIN